MNYFLRRKHRFRMFEDEVPRGILRPNREKVTGNMRE
jgi:hypothetical protein